MYAERQQQQAAVEMEDREWMGLDLNLDVDLDATLLLGDDTDENLHDDGARMDEYNVIMDAEQPDGAHVDGGIAAEDAENEGYYYDHEDLGAAGDDENADYHRDGGDGGQRSIVYHGKLKQENCRMIVADR